MVRHLTLAFDPGKDCGLALFFDKELVAHGTAEGDRWLTLVTALEPLLRGRLPPTPEARCVIEDGFNRGGKGSATLDRRRGLCQAAAEFYGFRSFLLVSPSTWQAKIFGGRVSNTKDASIAYATEKYSLKGISHDVADAVCIGTYALTAGWPKK